MRKNRIYILLIVFASVLAFTVAVQTYMYAFMSESAVGMEKTYLQNEVNNLVLQIDAMRESYEKEWTDSGKDFTEEDIKQKVVENLRPILYSMKQEGDAYIWINEVENWEGGDFYAFRVIHPNLRDTEGKYLSTKMNDAMGDFPYEEELEGIKKNGEITYSYYFKEKNSDQISRKMTYAKLYPDYSWIICFGAYYNQFTHSLTDNPHYNLMRTGYYLSLIGLIVVFILTTYVVISGKRQYMRDIRGLRRKVERDALTRAYSRSYGTVLLNECFESYQKTGKSDCFAIIDIDYFKQFNDTYGHNFGDYVLKETVSAIRDSLRDEDSVIRWGGDEFILVIHTDRAHLPSVIEKINRGVENRKFVTEEGENVNVTVSIGAGLFEKSDRRIENMTARIDSVLYEAKKYKNTGRIAEAATQSGK